MTKDENNNEDADGADDAEEKTYHEKIKNAVRKWSKNQRERYRIINQVLQESSDEYEYKEMMMQEAKLLKAEATQPLHYFLEEEIEEYGRNKQNGKNQDKITKKQKNYIRDLLEGNINNQQLFLKATKNFSNIKGQNNQMSDIMNQLTKEQASEMITKLEDNSG